MPRYADTSSYTEEEIALWNWLEQQQGRVFQTKRGLDFTIAIKGNELFIDRKSKGITRASVNMAYKKALEIKVIRKSPKELETFGASYLMPLFLDYGCLQMEGR